MNPMPERYDPLEVEGRWQRRWEELQLFAADRRPPNTAKAYVLEMFPYPSGSLHMGHVRVYGIGDVLARFARLQGKAVLHPMGYDSLGLPAENAAIKDGIPPRVRTAENIASFRLEMRRMGFSFDWSRELATSEVGYYRWNQWFFLRLWERDLIYRRRGWVNWCPVCQTVLANEQVDDGVCWRGHPGVLQKQINEWAFRITRFADALLDGLPALSDWPERITAMQRNWIGRSQGAEIDFAVVGLDLKISVYTTRLDTVGGCSYLVIAPEHPLTAQLVSEGQRAAVAAFAERMLKTDRLERTATTAVKEGVDTGARARNPFTGAEVPIWVANFVIADYGTGAVMSVPAHDARDFAFARKYQLPVVAVIAGVGQSAGSAVETGEGPLAPLTEDGEVVAGAPGGGLSSAAARAQLTARAEAEGFGRARVNYALRDWGFSRQRYWGTPIPVIYCPHEGTAEQPKLIPVPDAQLPVVLPDDVKLTGTGEPPLAKVAAFMDVPCPSCGRPARREADTMDTFVDSAWYFARFLDPHNDRAPFDPALAERWLPIDTYVGGPEHAVMHLLYFRFFTRAMKLLGLVNIDEPARRLITQGIVLGADGEKMSKSVGNVVAPGPYLDKYGADALRLFVLFAGPVDRDYAWSDSQVEGLYRFILRIWRLFRRALAQLPPSAAAASVQAAPSAGPSAQPSAQADGRALELRRWAHKTLKKVGDDLERVHFNTAIAALMEMLNGLQTLLGNEEDPRPLQGVAERAAAQEALEIYALCLSPFAPHLADELWAALGHITSTQEERWPAFDPSLLVSATDVYAVQVNGKLRGEVSVDAALAQADIEALAQAEPKVQSQLAGKAIRKVIFVPKRLVNFVVG